MFVFQRDALFLDGDYWIQEYQPTSIWTVLLAIVSWSLCQAHIGCAWITTAEFPANFFY